MVIFPRSAGSLSSPAAILRKNPKGGSIISRKGYTDEQLPTVKTITDKLNALGFRLRKVAKCRPQKK
jgi:hypothetical protein